jgi:hypothetical protein
MLTKAIDKINVNSLTYSQKPKPNSVDLKKLADKYTFSQTTKDWLKSPTFNNWEWDENELIELGTSV